MSIYHFNFLDKLRETFIGKTHEEMEKQKAFVRGTIVSLLLIVLVVVVTIVVTVLVVILLTMV